MASDTYHRGDVGCTVAMTPLGDTVILDRISSASEAVGQKVQGAALHSSDQHAVLASQICSASAAQLTESAAISRAASGERLTSALSGASDHAAIRRDIAESACHAGERATDGSNNVLNRVADLTATTIVAIGKNTVDTITAVDRVGAASAAQASFQAAQAERIGGEQRQLTREVQTSLLMESKDVQRQASENTCKIAEKLCETKYELARQADQLAAAAALTACQNASAIARQVEMCCCEQKLLFQKADNDRVSAALAASTVELSNCRLREELRRDQHHYPYGPWVYGPWSPCGPGNSGGGGNGGGGSASAPR